MMCKRNCKHCNNEYEYELFTNFITFCPHCMKFDYLECQYGYGPVVPCKIFLGSEVIAMITYDESRIEFNYRFDSDKFNIHKYLVYDYYDALMESINLTYELIDEYQ